MSVLNMFRVDGKVAFINGAGRGIGAASAIALAEAGADVAIRARTVSQLDEVAAAIEAFGRRVLVLPALEDPDDDVTALDRAAGEFGRLDILVNVVGGAMPGPFLAARDRDFEQAFQFNVMTAIRLVRAAVPHLLATGEGSIVNITTAAAHMVGRGFAVYGSAKAALDHATRLLAADLCPKIRVNAVAPGAILTDALAMVMGNAEIRASMERLTPLRRIGTPEEIAAAVLYLASPAGGFLTGKIIEVDGGTQVPAFEFPIPDL
jgi:7-alpha-hydroxysteroid dehydrogenase